MKGAKWNIDSDVKKLETLKQTAVAERLRVYVSGSGKIEAWGSNPARYSNAGLEPPPSPVNVDSERTIYGRTL